jgi:hypothetical protein
MRKIAGRRKPPPARAVPPHPTLTPPPCSLRRGKEEGRGRDKGALRCHALPAPPQAAPAAREAAGTECGISCTAGGRHGTREEGHCFFFFIKIQRRRLLTCVSMWSENNHISLF